MLAAAMCFAGEPEAPKPEPKKRPGTGLGLGPGMLVISNIPLGKEMDPNVSSKLLIMLKSRVP